MLISHICNFEMEVFGRHEAVESQSLDVVHCFLSTCPRLRKIDCRSGDITLYGLKHQRVDLFPLAHRSIRWSWLCVMDIRVQLEENRRCVTRVQIEVSVRDVL